MNLNFKYLAIAPLAGRGGVQRFFMLAHGIDFQEELFAPGPEWTAEKGRMMKEENPCGSLPVTYLQDGENKLTLSQHIATCRYLAKLHKIENEDAYKNYVQDLVADEYQGFRDAWAGAAFGEDDLKATYRTDKLPPFLTKFDALYKIYKTHDAYLSTSPSGNPLWADSALFGLLYDNIQTGMLDPADLEKHANLSALYKAHSGIPSVAAWIEANTKKEE